MLIYRLVTAQHILNKLLTKREIYNWAYAVFQLLFWLVEILLRVYIVYNQYVYTIFNNSTEK